MHDRGAAVDGSPGRCPHAADMIEHSVWVMNNCFTADGCDNCIDNHVF